MAEIKTIQLWTDTPDASSPIPPVPTLVRFESGVSIAVFFYNGPASRAIAFEGLLNSGENFAARLKSGFKEGAQPQLVHVATDGESYVVIITGMEKWHSPTLCACLRKTSPSS